MERTAGRSAAELYRGWSDHHEKLVSAIAPLDDARLNLSAPQLWSVRMLVGHVIAARAWWFHFFLSEGGTEFERYAHTWLDEGGNERYASWDDFEETASLEAATRRSAAELVQGLEETGSLIASPTCTPRCSDRSPTRRARRLSAPASGSSGMWPSMTSTTVARSRSPWGCTACEGWTSN